MRYNIYKNKILTDPRSMKLNFKPDGREHYVYRVTDLYDKELSYYYGSRTKGKENIVKDFWKYCTSSKSKRDLIVEFKEERFKLKVVKIFNNAGDKILYESFLHDFFNVKTNERFWNRSNQTPFGFDTTGTKLTKEHREAISSFNIERYKDETFYKKFCDTMKKSSNEPENVAKMSELIKKMHSNEEFKKKFKGIMAVVNNDINKRSIAGEAIKEKWKEEEFRIKNIESRIKEYVLTDDNGIVQIIRRTKELAAIVGKCTNKFLNTNIGIVSKDKPEFNGLKVWKLDTYKEFIATGEINVQKRIFSEQAKLNMSNSKKGNSKKVIEIFDDKGELKFTSEGVILKWLRENNLTTAFIISYKKKGEPIYKDVDRNLDRLTKSGMIKYKGWSAKIKE